MFYKIFIFILSFCLVFQHSLSIVCTPSSCAAVSCLAVENCDGPNQVIKPGGFCNCCNYCHTILQENESCSELGYIRGIPPPLAECGQGLVCHEGKCKNFKDLGKPQC